MSSDLVECGTEPMITNAREIAWMKKHLPDHHRVLVTAIHEGTAIITREESGCKAF